MKEPTIIQYIGLILACLLLAMAGLYLLTNYSRLFRARIRNEFIRRNLATWLIVFCISAAMFPMSGGFFYTVEKYGWAKLWIIQLVSTTANTLFVFNLSRWIARHKKLERLSFVSHNLLILISLIVLTVAVNIPLTYILYNYDKRYLGYSLVSSIYLSATIGLVYAMISYLDSERKRKFDEKELELSRLRELKTKAELDALHSKVNPHFLYNALNSIADLSITDGRKARKMTVALADLFRYSINYSDNNFSTLKEEMEMAEVYLLIEKIRFEDQLNYSIHFDEELNHYLVPRFLLQPLVENAVKHGLKATGRMTEIKLDVLKEGPGMVIRVADTGPGFPEQLLPGYGVKSVYDKLELLFPGQFSLGFHNEPFKQVSIHIHKLVKHEQTL